MIDDCFCTSPFPFYVPCSERSLAGSQFQRRASKTILMSFSRKDTKDKGAKMGSRNGSKFAPNATNDW